MSDVNFTLALTVGNFVDTPTEEIERIRRVVYAYVDLIHGISLRPREAQADRTNREEVGDAKP